MLRKRSRPVQNHSKGLLMADSTSDFCFSPDAVVPKAKVSSFFGVPRLFIGLCSAKGSSESDSAKSPTSPLDYRPFSLRSPDHERNTRIWASNRVGLGLVDSLNDEPKPCGRVLGVSGSNNILFGSRMRINIPSPKSHLDALRNSDLGPEAPKSLPKDYEISSRVPLGSRHHQLGSSKIASSLSNSTEVEPGELGKVRSCSTDISHSSLPLSRVIYHNPKSDTLSSDSKDLHFKSATLERGGKTFDNSSGSLPMSIGSSHGLLSTLSVSEIEQSEDYTCITSHGPNPKTTRIFGDCILESHIIHSPDCDKDNRGADGSRWFVSCFDDSPSHPGDEFLSFCFSCNKKLEDGKDIYIYRGERAFCSCECRDLEILIDEAMEKSETGSSDSVGSSLNDEMDTPHGDGGTSIK